MNKLLQILLLSLILPALCQGQFEDNFDDGDIISDPEWLGDVSAFIVNTDGELQLNDTDAGSKFLYLPYELSADFTWTMDIRLNFAPSANNNCTIYLLIDDTDFATANGYFLRIGENLSDDNLKFFKLTEGVEELVAEGELGALAQKPAVVRLQIDRIENLWTIATDYSGTGIPVEEISFFEETHEQIQSGFFGLNPKYTSSNSDEFYFDNIKGEIFTPDTEGPEITNTNTLNTTDLEVIFNEPINAGSLDNLTLDVSPENNTLSSSSVSGVNNNVLSLSFENGFKTGTNYTITVNGLEDEKGNIMSSQTFNFVISVAPAVGDIIINEILFDPPILGNDFIEIKNISDKLLNIQGLVIYNNTKEGSEEIINDEILMNPGEILAISDDTIQIKADYNPPAEANFYQMSIPSFNRDVGNVSLLLSDGSVIDSFDYSEGYHLQILDNVKGVSLERIFDDSGSVPENFTSGVESTNFATPGYENANFQNGNANSEGVFSVESTVFSPNADGDTDQLIMRINLPSNGYLTTIQVFNIHGQKVKTIQTNQLSGQEDISRWDGTFDDGTIAPVGHYILFFQAFNENGDSISQKKHVKLLDYF